MQHYRRAYRFHVLTRTVDIAMNHRHSNATTTAMAHCSKPRYPAIRIPYTMVYSPEEAQIVRSEKERVISNRLYRSNLSIIDSVEELFM